MEKMTWYEYTWLTLFGVFLLECGVELANLLIQSCKSDLDRPVRWRWFIILVSIQSGLAFLLSTGSVWLLMLKGGIVFAVIVGGMFAIFQVFMMMILLDYRKANLN